MHRHQLTDEQWRLVDPLIPKKTARVGRPPEDPREMLDGILWILRTGAPWRDLPERFGPCKTVYDYYSNWRKSGVFDRVLQALQIRLDRAGKIDWDLWCIDGSSVRAARCAEGADKKVASVISAKRRPNQRTTRWAAAAADTARSSTWSLTATACRWLTAPRPAFYVYAINEQRYPKEPKTLGDHLRKKRMDLGLEQEQLAKVLGVDKCSIRNWEHNLRNPRPNFRQRIVKFLGHSPAGL